MNFFQRIAYLLAVSSLFSLQSMGQASSCVFADAGPDDTICQGSCWMLTANVSGTRSSSVYLGSTIPYAPYPYTGGNPVIVNLDDVWSPVINIPFCFEFYGNVYNQLVIGTNGLITFDLSQANGNCPWTINTAAPNPALPLNAIMAPYHDIDPSIPTSAGATSINWQVYGTAPCRVFVVSWNDIAMFGAGCSSLTSTSQAALYESTNNIEIYVQDKSVCAGWNNGAAIEGLQNAAGTFATIVPGRNFPTQWTLSNDAVLFTPAGPPNYTLQWLDPAGNVISTSANTQVCPQQTTTYTLQMINTSCTGQPVTTTDQQTVYVTPSTLAVTDSTVLPNCFGSCNGSIDIFATGGVPPYTYVWMNSIAGNTPSVSGLCPGNYTCTVFDASGCSIVLNINLVAPPPFNINLAFTNTLCGTPTGTASATITGNTGPYSYLWNTGDTTANIANLSIGWYQVVVTDSNGCQDSMPVFIQSNGLLTTSVINSPLLCNGDCNAIATVTALNGVGPYTYSWTPYGGTSATATGLCAGFFSCVITDATGCFSTDTVQVFAPSPVTLVPASNLTLCLGQSTLISASATGGIGPYTYAWNHNLPPNAVNPISPTQTTIYTVIATDANGCSSPPQSTLVKVNDLPMLNFTASPGDCPPAIVSFTNLTDSAVSYQWNFGDPASGVNDTSSLVSPTHVYNYGGVYNVMLIAINAYGCSDTLMIPNAVTMLTPPTAALNVNAQVLTSLDPTSTFTNGSSGAQYYFVDFGDGDTMTTFSAGPYEHTYDSTGTYLITLIAYGSNGCTDVTWVSLRIEDPTTFYLPNAFTPNNDGTNDVFMVYGINVAEFELYVFDRWGNLIFTSYDMSKGWDGTYKDQRCQEDVYVWRLNYTDIFGTKYERIGRVALVR